MNFKIAKSRIIQTTPILILFFGVLFTHKTAHACEMLKPDKSEIFINPDSQYLHFGSQLRTAGPITSEIFKCQKEAGQYLMYSIGVKRPGLFSDVEHISYDGGYNKSQCRFKNSNINDSKFEDQVAEQIQKQHHFVRTCMYLRIRDVNRTPIEFDPNQKACRLRAQTSGTILMDGPYCFTKIHRNQHLQISVEVKQDCLNPEYLESQNISSQDLNVVVNTWVAGDDSGVSSDLEYLRSIPLKVSLLPSKKILSKSTNLNNPEIEFSNSYNVDIRQGPFSIQKVGQDRYNIDFAVEVSNRSYEICKTGLPCAGLSNYQMPVAGRLELSEVTRSGDEYIKSWPFLAIAPAQYQGVLKNTLSPVLENYKLSSSKKYKLTFKMIDPYDDYWIALSQIMAIKFNLPTPNETLDNIQSTPTTDVMGELKGLSSLPSSMVNMAITGSLDELNRALRGTSSRNMWPPKYDQVCMNGQRCRSIDNIKEVTNLELPFQVQKVDPNTNQIVFKNTKQLPSYECQP